MRRGMIRFVGGPLHNRHLAVEWRPRLEWVKFERPAGNPDAPYQWTDRTYYELRQMFCVVRLGGRVPTQLRFFEYHCLSDLRPNSGDGFFQPLPDVEFKDFCWRLMTAWNALVRAHLGLGAIEMF